MKLVKGDKVVYINELSHEIPWGANGTVIWSEENHVRVEFEFSGQQLHVTCSPYEIHSRRSNLELI